MAKSKYFEYIYVNCKESDCPVRSTCSFLPTEYITSKNNTVDILFVGQGGGATERIEGRPFIGDAGQRLRKTIMVVCKNSSLGFAFSNTIRDNPEGNREPSPSELSHCLGHLYLDIDKLRIEKKLKVVMLLGKSARNSVLLDKRLITVQDTKKPVKELCGREYPVRIVESSCVIYMPSYHPAAIIRQSPSFNGTEGTGIYEKAFISDLRKAVSLCAKPAENHGENTEIRNPNIETTTK